MKLYTRPASFRAQKVLIAAEYANVKLDVDTKTNESALKSKSSIARLPLLETPKGCLVESNAIARYIANTRPDSGLAGSTLLEKAQVDSWMDFCSNEVEVPACVLVYPVIGWMSYHQQASDKAAKDLKSTLQTLESHLKSRTFLVGESMTLADIAIACALLLPMKIIMDEKYRKSITCVTRWFLTCVNQPEFSKVVGQVVLCKKALKVDAKAAAAPASKGGKKEKSGKKDKAAAPKKEKAAAPAAEAPKKKPKNPLDLLPKSSMSLDRWKKEYSNAKDGDCYNAMPWFWENLDKEGYSIYHAKYNYNEELKVSFMTSNLAGGFVQRCDEIRKYAFGIIQIVGKEGGPMEIIQTWLFRGQDEKPILNANPDAEHYTWTKVTDFNAAEKKKIEDMWCAWETIEGKPILDCKVFK